jgi:hypothetical protein
MDSSVGAVMAASHHARAAHGAPPYLESPSSKSILTTDCAGVLPYAGLVATSNDPSSGLAATSEAPRDFDLRPQARGDCSKDAAFIKSRHDRQIT